MSSSDSAREEEYGERSRLGWRLGARSRSPSSAVQSVSLTHADVCPWKRREGGGKEGIGWDVGVLWAGKLRIEHHSTLVPPTEWAAYTRRHPPRDARHTRTRARERVPCGVLVMNRSKFWCPLVTRNVCSLVSRLAPSMQTTKAHRQTHTPAPRGGVDENDDDERANGQVR